MLKLNILKQEVINNLNQRHTFRSRAKAFRTERINYFCVKNGPYVHKFLLLTYHVYHGTRVRELLTLSGNFQDCPEIYQTVWKLFTLLETFQTVWKLFRLRGNFPDCPKTFQTVKNFPDCPDTFHDDHDVPGVHDDHLKLL